MNQIVSNDIVLLGNGMVSRDRAEWVDQCAFVVRFNIPRNGGALHGKRCDALCVTNHGMPARRFAKYRKMLNHPFVHPQTEIWFPRPLWNRSLSCHFNHFSERIRWRQDHSAHIISRNGWQKQTQVYFSDAIWQEACSILSLDQNQWQISPSSGFLALTYTLRRFPPCHFRIHLLGFSFIGSEVHPWALEEKTARRWANDGRIVWKKESDLDRFSTHAVPASASP